MVFVSLEGFIEGGVSATRVAVPHAQRPPQAPVHVVVTPGSPVKPAAGHKRSRLRRATSAFSSLAKSASPTDVAAAGVAGVATAATADAFVVYVTDRDVHHKWVLAKSPDELAALKKALQSELARCACRAFACCGPLRRVAASAQYKAPKRRWSDSRLVSQFGRCGAVQEFLNDLLLAVLRRDAECEATRAAWRALSAFLDVETQRSEVADKIVLRTVGGGDHQQHQHLRRSLSEQLPTRRTSCADECRAAKPHAHPHCGSDAGSDTDTSDPDDEDAECPICCAPLLLDEAAAGDEPAAMTARLLCGHAYHAECVRVWLRMQHTCPVCRIPIEGM